MFEGGYGKAAKIAVNNFDLVVKPGECFGLLGACGHTRYACTPGRRVGDPCRALVCGWRSQAPTVLARRLC